jgi:hypothetical protein
MVEAAAVLNKIGNIVFVAVIAFLAFVGGALIVLSETFPHQLLRDAWRAGEALAVQEEIQSDPVKTNLWQPARSDDRGVTVHDPEQAWPGYTLYTSGDDNVARLIDMDGNLVHEWRRPFSDVWQEGAEAASPQADSLVFMDQAQLLPNGDIIAVYTAAADTPWGYGMVRLDRDSNIVWRYLGRPHHDFDILPDGRIVVLTHRFQDEPPRGAGFLGRPFLADAVVVLSPEGEELQRIPLTEAVAASRYQRLLGELPYYAREDPLHSNDVDYIDAETARVLPDAQEGDVMVSLRNIRTLAVLSLETGEIRWAMTGPWIGQHDPTVLPDGEILLFDNYGALDPGNSARVIRFDPATQQITWSYSGSAERPFDSRLRSSAQPLANGNILVTESDGGRLFEVTRAGEIVWEYINPVRGGDQDQFIPVFNWASRIDPETLDPDFRALLEGE